MLNMMNMSNIWRKTWKKWIKKGVSHSKKETWYWGHLSYMCKSKSGESLLGVEPKPKKMEEAHSIQEQENGIVIFGSDLDEKIHQWKVSSISLVNFFFILEYYRSRKPAKLSVLENRKKSPSIEARKKERKGARSYTLIRFSQVLLNRMHQKMPVRLRRDTVLS